MNNIAQYLPLAITILVFLMKLMLGFNTRREHLTYFRGNTGLLIRSLMVALVFPPILAIALVNFFNPAVIPAATLLLLSAAPGAPLAALKAYKYDGNYSFGISLEIILVSASVFTLPLSLGLFNRYFELNLSAEWLELSREIFMVVVLPMLIGYTIGRLKPSWVTKFGIRAGKAVNILLLVMTLPLLWGFRGSFLELGVTEYLIFLLFVAILYLLGHYAGGSRKRDRTTLAVLSSSRHVGICLFVAVKSYERMDFLQVLVPYLIVTIILGIIYNKLTPDSADQNVQ